MSIQVTPTLIISDSDFEEHFIRASGPGGQNVNKVSSAVELRFDLSHCNSLSIPVKERLKALAKNQINKEGILIVVSQEFRLQDDNRKNVREKLIALIKKALHVPKARKKTKATRASKEKRLQGKKVHSDKKKTRSRPEW